MPRIGLSRQLSLNNRRGGGIPYILKDGATEAFYEAYNEIYVTKDSNNIVSKLDDISGKDHHLSGANGVWDNSGINFNGDNAYLRASFALSQPTFIYAIIKQVTWTANDRIWDGWNYNTGALFQYSSSPFVAFAAPSVSNQTNNFTINQYHIIRALYDGENSKIIIDENTPIIDDAGVADMSGITIGAKGGLGLYSNFKLHTMIIRSNTNGEQSIYNYLKKKSYCLIGF